MKRVNQVAKARWGILLSVDEAAEYIALSPKTIRNELSKGTFPVKPRRFGKRVLFNRRDLDEFADSLPHSNSE